MGIPDYQPSIGYAPHCPPVSAKGVSHAWRHKLSALNLDNENIRALCDALRRQYQDQGVAFGDLSKLVKQSLEGRQFQQPREETGRPHPLIRPDLIDSRGNLGATDIGITWQGSDTFLHGIRVAGPEEDIEDTRHRPVTSTPYAPVCEHPSCGMSTPRPPRPVCMEIFENYSDLAKSWRGECGGIGIRPFCMYGPQYVCTYTCARRP